MIFERVIIFDFCFEKKVSGSWCDWMDIIDKFTLVILVLVKVGKYLYKEKFKSYYCGFNNI